MKKNILFSIVFLYALTATAQINAITESGDQVVLYEDGTWKYVDNATEEEVAITENKKNFTKNKKASFLVKSKKLNVGIWINPKKWSFVKGTEKDNYEYEFTLKGEDLYAMLIAEKVQIPLTSLIEIALNNAKNVSPDVRVIKKEYRTVNGVKVLMMQMAGTIKGIKFKYFGYYYSNSNGTIQLLAFTGAQLFDNYTDEIEDFLNGFVEL